MIDKNLSEEVTPENDKINIYIKNFLILISIIMIILNIIWILILNFNLFFKEIGWFEKILQIPFFLFIILYILSIYHIQNPEKITKKSLLEYNDQDELNDRIKKLEPVVTAVNRAIYTPMIILLIMFLINIFFGFHSIEVYSINFYLIIINSIIVISVFMYPWKYMLIRLRHEANLYKDKAITDN